MFGLEYLVAPLTVEQFITEFWGQRAAYIPGDDDKFEGLFGFDDVNDHLNNSARPDQFRLIYEKRPLPKEQLSHLDTWLQRGATLAINGVNLTDEAMGRFNESLGGDLNTHINTNCYVSCPTKQGFDLHFDEHCVFVVQTEGRKAWKVFKPTLTYPLHAQMLTDKGAPPDDDPYLECLLTPGDVLFVPRGHWHYALAETPSVHLTVGPTAKSGAEFLMWIARQLMHRDGFFRQDFPVAGAAALGGPLPDERLTQHLETFRQKVVEAVQEDALLEALIRYCMETNPVRRPYHLPDDWGLQDQIAPETRFQIPTTQKLLPRYDPDTLKAVVHVRGHLIELDGIPESLMHPLFGQTGVVVTGAQLLAEAPTMTWERLGPALLQLYRHGVLQLVDDDETDGTSPA